MFVAHGDIVTCSGWTSKTGTAAASLLCFLVTFLTFHATLSGPTWPSTASKFSSYPLYRNRLAQNVRCCPVARRLQILRWISSRSSDMRAHQVLSKLLACSCLPKSHTANWSYDWFMCTMCERERERKEMGKTTVYIKEI